MSTNKWMSQLTKDFGIIAADLPSPADDVIRMPSPSLNWAVSNGGLVRGKAVCLFGPESGGKSLLMQLIIAQVQRNNPEAIGVLFDSEYSFNKAWFQKLGGDPARLIVRQTNDPIKIFDYMSVEGDINALLQDGAPIEIFGIDSVKGIRYPKDIKKQTTAQTMGGSGASYLGPALKGILPVMREHNMTGVLVQQVYEEMDEYKKMSNPYIVPDGRALKHFCDYMIQVERLETKAGRVEDGKDIAGNNMQVGHVIRAKCKKNRLGAPYRVAQLKLSYEHGIIDVANELFDLAKSLNIIYHPTNAEGRVNNMMWAFGNYDPIRGEANMRQWVLERADIQAEIEAALLSASDDAINARNEELAMTDIDLNLEDL